MEHYCRCPRTRELFRRRLHLPHDDDFVGIHTFLLCSPFIDTEEALANVALAVYAVYTVTNRFRHHAPSPGTDAYEALVQATVEGARHHARAPRLLDSNWCPGRTTTPLAPIPPSI